MEGLKVETTDTVCNIKIVIEFNKNETYNKNVVNRIGKLEEVDKSRIEF